MSSAPFVVCKFGGTSVASAERWATIAAVAQQRVVKGERPVLVCSALSTVSDALEALQAAALDGAQGPLLEQLRRLHSDLADALGVALPMPVQERLDFLSRITDGIHLVGEISPRVRARVMASGELMSTHLGLAALRTHGLDAAWVDARSLLESQEDESLSVERRYLAASFALGEDPELQTRLQGLPGAVIVTQGFIARRAGSPPDAPETVLLGRGGSDTSAALLAARLAALRCEIWTDVPGMFTGNPRQFPGARLLRELNYAEAQEIATTGAKVLHPGAIPPVKQADIPLEIHCTPHPGQPGTTVRSSAQAVPGIKAVSARAGVVLVSMETVGMWQQVGFLANAFSCFKNLGLSIDLVATSETNVTVSLDPAANLLDDATLGRLVRALTPLCEPTIVRNCASVSLVGQSIRSILHRLAGVFELFEEQRVLLVTQAASDLNLTVVVEQSQADRLVAQLHELLLAEIEGSELLGPSWAELSAGSAPMAVPGETRWWRRRRAELLAAADRGTPRYVYDLPTVLSQARALTSLSQVGQVLFAMKANPNRQLLEALADAGLGFECVSPGEVALAREVLGDRGPILFTPNFAAREEYEAGFQAGAFVTLDNLHPLEAWPQVFAGRQVFVRIDPGKGAGHHAHVRTAGARSKFGVAMAEVPRLAELARQHGVVVVGLHAHVGSGVRDPKAWPATATTLAALSRHLPDVRILDLGGGLGVPEKAGQAPLDLSRLDALLGEVRQTWPQLELWLEPGRFLVAAAGVLLARVNQRKQKGPLAYVGVDAGMHTLIRPALYGAWHDIVNLSRLGETGPLEEVDVVGPICETGDVLGRGRRLVAVREGDVLLIDTAGAYGAAMSSGYNLRGLPAEEILG